MAAALVGGAFVSAALQFLFDRMASREVLGYFQGRKLDGLLKKLEITLLPISAVLDDAEEKQIINHNVKKWLDELKDAVYDAEDLLDEISYEALRCKLEDEPQTTTTQVRNYFSSFNPFNKGMRSKLGEILGRLEYMSRQIKILGLRKGLEEKSSQKVPSTSLVDEAFVCGRDTDKEAIMKFLLSEEPSASDIAVIPIWGMGGIGKTTLAQLVYNDGKVKECFELRAWVCVSEEFDVSRITKIILQQVTAESCSDKDLNQLHLTLKERLSEKKFLIVLDDAWNRNFMDWDSLQGLFKFGAKGSRIIVTTRDETVASILKTVPTYHLEPLSDDASQLLFVKHAFRNINSTIPPNLVAISKEIAERCKGLPLAIKALAGVLRSKVTVKEWVQVLESNIWYESGNILPPLLISYHYLPSHLKRCFAYCSMFPKDYEFEKEELIQLWIAEGFLDHSNCSKKIVEMGEEYFNDMIARSFFQRSTDNKSRFVMHDLINDLARLVSGEFCCRLEGYSSCGISKKTRHLANLKSKYNVSKKFKSVEEARGLRTFLTLKRSKPSKYDFYFITDTVTHNLLPKLKCLRVLSLFNYENIYELPDSISDLKHLRYLDFSETNIKRLPESVGTLYFLQLLKLFRCRQLVALPTKLGRLINLHFLDIRETKVKEMPLHLGRLKNLHILTSFVLGEQSGSPINELKELQHLQGTLSILNLQNVVSSIDVKEANLRGKQCLHELVLSWGDDGDANDSEQERDLLDKLQPHTNLLHLVITNYRGTRLPNWVGDCSFSSIASLKLMKCQSCFSLPCLGQLPSLKELLISYFCEVMMVDDAEFSGICSTGMRPFRSLEVLKFEYMLQWEEWVCAEGEDEEVAPFPCLKELYLIDCPKLTTALPNHLPSLTKLEIKNCGQLVASLPKATTMHELELSDCGKLLLKELPFGLYKLRISGCNATDSLLKELVHDNTGLEKLFIYRSIAPHLSFPCCGLKEVTIKHCNSLISFPLELFPELNRVFIGECKNLESLFASEGPHQDLISLQYLFIWLCPKFVCFPEGGISAPNLTDIRINGCRNLKALPQHMYSLLPSLEMLSLHGCKEIESFPEGGLPSSLKYLYICRCPKLVTSRKRWCLQGVSSLTSFTITGGCDNLESFPEEDLLPSTLTFLGICGIKNLKSLNEKGLQHFTFLSTLCISNCPNLKSLPIQGLPTSISELSIWSCPLLSQQCQKEYWPIISHIPAIIINHKLIS